MGSINWDKLECKHGLPLGAECRKCKNLIDKVTKETLEWVRELEDHQKRDVSKSDIKFGAH